MADFFGAVALAVAAIILLVLLVLPGVGYLVIWAYNVLWPASAIGFTYWTCLSAGFLSSIVTQSNIRKH